MTEKEMWAAARLFPEYKGSRADLVMIVCYCDRILWKDKSGNYWEEYVPTFD